MLQNLPRVFPLPDVVEGGELVEEDDGPEDTLETDLGVLVAQDGLREEGAGPAAEEGDEVQIEFRDAPAGGDGAAFVVPVEDEGEERDGDGVAEDEARIDRGRGQPAQSVTGDDERNREQ